MSTYDILTNLYYTINSNSSLNGIIPLSETKSILSISEAKKLGTLGTTDVPILGTLSLHSDITYTAVNFEYECKDLYEGDDSFEFLIYFTDGSSSLQRVNLTIKPKYLPNSYKEIYKEMYMTAGINTFTTSLTNADQDKKVATTIDVCTSDSSFTVEKASVKHDMINSVGSQKFTQHDIELLSNAKYGIIYTDTDVEVKYMKNVDINITKKGGYMGEEYFIVKFKHYIDLVNGNDLDYVEIYYITLHARGIYEINDGLNIVLPPIQTPTYPFTYPTVEYPEKPEEDLPQESEEPGVIGDLLYNSRPHEEFDNFGNKTIKLGTTVPDGGVNLAYYYNKIAASDDTVSIMETDTNTVTLKYVEEWIHKKNLPTNDKENFPDTIEFNGLDGTEYEGYWGILYRDYIFWDEILDINQNPEYKIMYEQFLGLSTKYVPIKMKYDDGNKFGLLNLSHTLFAPVDFKDLGNEVYTPRRWNCNTKYEGIIKEKRLIYNGSARYSGTVTKKDGLSNIDPEQPKEFIMRPDITGLLYNLKGEKDVDDELFYITDKFKDGVPLYFRHKLKTRIYDNVGVGKYNIYRNNSIKLVNENGGSVDTTSIKYKVCIESTQYKNIYDAYLYISTLPTAEAPLYVIYDGIPEESYVGKEKIDHLNINVGIIEKISPLQYMDVGDYEVINKTGLTMQSNIKLKNYQAFEDKRTSIKIEYIIEAEGFKTPPIPVYVVNKKDALFNELDKFRNDDMIASIKDNNGYMTAKDILFSFLTYDEQDLIGDDAVYTTYFNLADYNNTMFNKDKVLLYTNADGSGLVYARTYCDTGIIEEDGTKSDYLDEDNYYVSDGAFIYKCYSVMCRNVNQVTLANPVETNTLKGWFPRVRYSYFNKVYERIDKIIKIIYTLPEYFNQIFGTYGRPYIDIKDETPVITGKNSVKLSRTPLYVKVNSVWEPQNIKAKKILGDGTEKMLSIKSFNFKYGIIEFEDNISDNDTIKVDYTYEEQFYHYRGYYESQDIKSKLINLNLNPVMYNTFTDTNNDVYEDRNCYELFNRTIYFFIRPSRIIDMSDGSIISENKFTIYHSFDQKAEGPFDLHIGRIFVRHHTSLKATEIIDTRSRGGGIIESMSDELRQTLEPDSDFYMDIGTLDGKPYQSNSVLIVRLDNRLLKVNGGRFTEDEVKQLVLKWAAYGVLPIIEYVNVIYQNESPQNTMIVNRHMTNQFSYNPYVECIVTEV